MSTGTQPRPWHDAEIREGTVPQQRFLYPRPVVLECRDCYRGGYWYPAGNRIDVTSRMCDTPGGWRPYHAWGVESWNGNEPVSAADAAEVTDMNIAGLEQAAANAGDSKQVILCRVALGGDLEDWMTADAAGAGIDTADRDAARAECARVILDYRQQRG